MADRKWRWLQNEIGDWEREGLVDAVTAGRLRERYEAAASSAISWGRVIFGSLGSTLVGLGIIALLAANWGGLPRDVRAALAFTPLTLCIAFYACGRCRNWNSRVFLEPLGILWGLSAAAGIALISQTYHMPGELEDFLFAWMLLLVPVMYATASMAVVAGYFIGLLVWVSLAKFSGGVGLFFWPMALLAVPVISDVRREPGSGIRANLMLWSAALCSTGALGVTLEKSLPGLWMIIYSAAFSTLFLLGMRARQSGCTLWQNPLRTLGGCGLGVVLYLLMFEWPWQEIGPRYWREETSFHAWAAGFDFCLAVVLPVVAALLLVRAARGSAKLSLRGAQVTPVCVTCAWGAAPFVTAAAYVVASYSERESMAALMMMIYLLMLGLATLGTGLAARRLSVVNAGTVILLGVILGKFFSSDVSFTVKGVSFIVCGCLFLGMNLWVSRRLSTNGVAS